MRILFVFCLMVLSACNGPVEDTPSHELSYTFTPTFSEAENRLDVKVNFKGDADGETNIRVGARWSRDEKAGKRFRNLNVSGMAAQLPADIDQAVLSIEHAPDADLTVTYTLSSEDMDDASENIEYFYVPVLLDDVIHLIGSSSLIIPNWDAPDTKFNVSFSWVDLPEGWTHVDTLPGRDLHPRELGAQVLAAAPSEYVSVSGNAYELTILKAGEHDFSSTEFRAKTISIYESLNRLWDTNEPRFLVTLLGTPENSSYSSFTGTGRFNSFASAASRDIELDFLSVFIAHEVAHHWVPGELGQLPTCQAGETCAPRITWFSEGFTDFVATRAKLSGGHWTQSELIDFTNQYLRNYYLSAAKSAKAEIVDDLFLEDYEHEKQPYWRGFLLAMNWDTEIRSRTGGQSSAMSVMQSMYTLAKDAPEDDYPILTSEYIAGKFSAEMGRDAFKDVERFYHEGEILQPHPNMFPDCGILKSTPAFTYDVGFNAEVTLSTGIVSGVSETHNAAKAGLKNGQVFVAKVSGGGGDTTKSLVLNVEDNGNPLKVSYEPVSGDPIYIPQFEKIGKCE